MHVKDLLKYVCTEVPKDTKLTDIMRPATFIPESKKCDELFANKTQIAIIVDEYGGTEGIVTIEDLVESIVGNIQDEYDNEEDEFYKESDTSFIVDGISAVDEVSDLIGMTNWLYTKRK